MSSNAIEVIMTRQLASYLAMPVVVVDPQSNLLYYNEAAELIMGRRFDETGPVAAASWAKMFCPTDASGQAIPPENLPLVRTLATRRICNDRFWITARDGGSREIAVNTFPLLGQEGRLLGAVAVFGEQTA